MPEPQDLREDYRSGTAAGLSEKIGQGSLHLTSQEGESPRLLPTDLAGVQYRCQAGLHCLSEEPALPDVTAGTVDAQETVGGQAWLSSGWSMEEWKRRNVGANSGAVLLMKSGSQLCGWWCQTAPAQEVSFLGHFFL